jgi:hypothetical protein
MERYVWTGKDARGRQFKPIFTNTPQHYNIFHGTLWEMIDGKRKKIRSVWN